MIVRDYKLGKHIIPVTAILGSGDVEIIQSADVDNKFTMVSFHDGEHHEIGVDSTFENGETSDDNKDIPMAIMFTDPRSIDSLIHQLELAKESLIKIKEGE